MKLKNISLSLSLSAAAGAMLLMSACSTPKNITYFQDVTDGMEIVPQKQLDIRVQPGDKLQIIVSTQDPTLSTLFNLVQLQNRLGNTTSSATLSPSAANSGNGQTAYYTVDKKGDINFPVVGKIHIGGMTRSEVAECIENRLSKEDLVKDPVVSVEFMNTGISIIGDVNNPGRYEFNQDRLNILDAIAMAGDLTNTGLRENVIVMRQNENGTQTAYRIDLTDMANLTHSPVYFLQQNDVIYVDQNDKKKRVTTSSGNTTFSPSFWVSIGSVGITLATLITTLSK